MAIRFWPSDLARVSAQDIILPDSVVASTLANAEWERTCNSRLRCGMDCEFFCRCFLDDDEDYV